MVDHIVISLNMFIKMKDLVKTEMFEGIYTARKYIKRFIFPYIDNVKEAYLL